MFQTRTSTPQTHTHTVLMLFVPIFKDPTTVNVNPDIIEMDGSATLGYSNCHL